MIIKKWVKFVLFELRPFRSCVGKSRRFGGRGFFFIPLVIKAQKFSVSAFLHLLGVIIRHLRGGVLWEKLCAKK